MTDKFNIDKWKLIWLRKIQIIFRKIFLQLPIMMENICNSEQNTVTVHMEFIDYSKDRDWTTN